MITLKAMLFPLLLWLLVRALSKSISLSISGVPHAQDWKVICNREDFADFVCQARAIESALGHPVKKRAPIEDEPAIWARKSLVTTRPIAQGEALDEQCLIAKRPGGGIAPWKGKQLIGCVMRRSVPADHMISWSDFDGAPSF